MLHSFSSRHGAGRSTWGLSVGCTCRWRSGGSGSRSSSRRSGDISVHTHLGYVATGNPQVDEWLHGLGVLFGEQAEDSADIDEVDEAGVEMGVRAQIPELQPVLPVEVGVDAKHLLVHHLDFCLEALREARALAQPVIWIVRNLLRIGERRSSLKVVGWQKALILNFASHPCLDVLDVGRGR